MPYFDVVVERSQVQFQVFTIKAKDQKSLEKKLEKLDLNGELSQIDERFDEGEVNSIEYSVSRVSPSKNANQSFASEDLQELVDN
jgi:hypothetical protein